MAKRALDYNYAKDEDFANTVKTNLLSIFENIRGSRREREDRWQDHYRAWSVDKTDADKNYDGMADLKVPQLRKEVETMTRRLYKGITPDDYLKSEPKEMAYSDLAEVQSQVLTHYFDNVIHIKQKFMPWIKQGVLYGTSPIRSYWHKETNEMLYKKRVAFEDKNGTVGFKRQIVQEDIVLYDAPKVRTEDLFNVWVYPHNAGSPEDIEVTFCRNKVQLSFLKVKAEQGQCHDLDKIKDKGNDQSWSYEQQQERLQQFGETGMFLAVQGDKLFDFMEIWCKLVLPGATKPTMCVVEIVGDHCTRIQRNPYWHQQSPFDWMRYIIPPSGEFYGRGLPEAGLSLQHQLDDTMNQTMDSNTLALNNITVINPAYAPNSESFVIEPGATWWADPAAVKQFQFPDLSDSGIKAAQILRGIIGEMSDNSPQLPDPIAGKARSTGQAQLAINEWQTDLYTFIDFITVEALAPLAFKTHSLIQQYISDDAIIRVAGKYAGTLLEMPVTPDQIIGNYNFTWIGALQIENKSVKTQQLLNLLKIYPTLPPDAQAAIKMNWPNIMIKLLRDGFNIRDVENIISTDKMRSAVPPKVENLIVKNGGIIETHKDDNDKLHLQEHMAAMKAEKDLYRRAILQKHIFEHEQQAQNKQAAAAMAQMQLQQMAAQGAPPPGGAPAQGGGRPGNPGMIPQSTNQPDMERGMRLE